MTKPDDFAKRVIERLQAPPQALFSVTYGGHRYTAIDHANGALDGLPDDVQTFASDFFASVQARIMAITSDPTGHRMITVFTPIPDGVDIDGDDSYFIVLLRFVDKAS